MLNCKTKAVHRRCRLPFLYFFTACSTKRLRPGSVINKPIKFVFSLVSKTIKIWKLKNITQEMSLDVPQF